MVHLKRYFENMLVRKLAIRSSQNYNCQAPGTDADSVKAALDLDLPERND